MRALARSMEGHPLVAFGLYLLAPVGGRQTVDEFDVGCAPPRRHQAVRRRPPVFVREDHGVLDGIAATALAGHVPLDVHQEWDVAEMFNGSRAGAQDRGVREPKEVRLTL